MVLQVRAWQLVVAVLVACALGAAAAVLLPVKRRRAAADDATGGDKVSLFFDANFGAEFAQLGAGEYPSMDAAAMGWEDDKEADISFGEALSSLRIPAGLGVTLYTKSKFGGKSLKLGAGEHRLQNYALDGTKSDNACGRGTKGKAKGKFGGSSCWNDTASSLKVYAA